MNVGLRLLGAFLVADLLKRRERDDNLRTYGTPTAPGDNTAEYSTMKAAGDIVETGFKTMLIVFGPMIVLFFAFGTIVFFVMDAQKGHAETAVPRVQQRR